MSLLKFLTTFCATFLLCFSWIDGVNASPSPFIVEFTDLSVTTAILFDSLSSICITASIRLDLRSQLFNGVSFDCEGYKKQTLLKSINGLPMVKSAWVVQSIGRPVVSLNTIVTPNLESRIGTVRKRSDKSLVTDINHPHSMTGIDKLHEIGFTGEGIFVGVIDTGINYNHNNLGGGCFLKPECKVIAGYDLVGDDFTGFTTPVPKSDPMDRQGHGTHVSGIIAASGPNPYNMTGVLPDAKLGMWKIFGREGGTAADVVIKALGMAVEAGVDLISMSLGSPHGFSDGPAAIAVQRAVDNGIPVIVASGNNGTDGLFWTAAPADASGSIAVGSVNNDYVPELLVEASYTITKSNTSGNSTVGTKFEYSEPSTGDYGDTYMPVYAITFNTSDIQAGCTALLNSTLDLSPYVVLIPRGSCALSIKVAHAVAAGAKKVIFYNNGDTGLVSPELLGDFYSNIPAGMVDQSLGVKWTTVLKAGKTVRIKFTGNKNAKKTLYQFDNKNIGGSMSFTSSWGPTYDGFVKPQVSAPGAGIFSTWLDGRFAVENGTSMAAPMVAGIVGLIKQIRGKQTLNPYQIGSLLASTADVLDYNDGINGYNYLAPVVQQGGGLSNAYKAAYIETLIEPASIALNDTQGFIPTHQFQITNLCSSAQSYTFEHLRAATVYTLAPNGIAPEKFSNPNELDLDASDSSAADVTFEPSTIVIPAGGTANVTACFHPPQGLDEARIPIISGYLGINGTSGDSLTLPYAGILTNLSSVQIMDTQHGYPWLSASEQVYLDRDYGKNPVFDIVLPNNKPLTNFTKFTLPSNASAPTNLTINYPSIVFSLAMGTEGIIFDIIPQFSTNTTKFVGENVLHLLGPIAIPRNAEFYYQWDGSVGEAMAPPGRYKFLTRVLKIMTDQNKPQSYERYESLEFEISIISTQFYNNAYGRRHMVAIQIPTLTDNSEADKACTFLSFCS